MWLRKLLIGLLALGLLCGPSLALSEPLPSSLSVALSQSEYDEVLAAMEKAKAQLEASSTTIELLSSQLEKSNSQMQRLSRNSTLQWILCGTLAIALAVEGTAQFVRASR
jgi:multidrug resistance efflux pump